MYKINIVGDVARQGCSESDNVGICIRTIGDTDGPKRVKDKINIIMLDKINKILILVSN